MASPSATASTSAAALDQRAINTIRFLAVDAVEAAQSGHPGMPMGAAPMGYLIYDRFMRYNPQNPAWPDRDRFILSAGHGSMLVYSLLHLTGYNVPMEELENFRQWGSKTPGHPEFEDTPGVETTTGPLGQGFANGVGMALAERRLAARFNTPAHRVVDHHTYGIVSDGDLMEGLRRRPPRWPGISASASSSTSTTTTASPSTARRTWPSPRTCPRAFGPTAGTRSPSTTATTSTPSTPPSTRPRPRHRAPRSSA